MLEGKQVTVNSGPSDSKAGLRGLTLSALAKGYEEFEWFAIDSSELLKFDEVHSPLSQFTFGNESVSPTQPPCRLCLRQTGTLPSFHEASREFPVGPLIGIVSRIHVLPYSQCLTSSPKWGTVQLHRLRRTAFQCLRDSRFRHSIRALLPLDR